jgi:hypothetical protein
MCLVSIIVNIDIPVLQRPVGMRVKLRLMAKVCEQW